MRNKLHWKKFRRHWNDWPRDTSEAKLLPECKADSGQSRTSSPGRKRLANHTQTVNNKIDSRTSSSSSSITIFGTRRRHDCDEGQQVRILARAFYPLSKSLILPPLFPPRSPNRIRTRARPRTRFPPIELFLLITTPGSRQHLEPHHGYLSLNEPLVALGSFVWVHAFSRVGREAPVRTEPRPTTSSTR